MKYKWLFLLILIILTASVSGCDKYEYHCKKLYGEYTLNAYRVNGADSLNVYKNVLGDNFHFQNDEVNSFHNLRIYGIKADGQLAGDINCRWQLINDYNTFRVYAAYGAAACMGPFGDGITPDWEIINISKVINMRTMHKGKEYEIELK